MPSNEVSNETLGRETDPEPRDHPDDGVEGVHYFACPWTHR